MQREKMEYKAFERRHNAVQSGRGGGGTEREGPRGWRDDAAVKEKKQTLRH